MKQFGIAGIILMTCCTATAQVALPGTQDTALIFREADVACTCRLTTADVESERPLATPPHVMRQMRGTLVVEDVFKPSSLRVGEMLTVRFAERFGPGSMGGDPIYLEPGQSAIVFLKRMPDGSFEWSDPEFGIVYFYNFKVLPKASRGTGLTRLESVLLNILEQTPPGDRYHDDLRALYMLEGMPALSREGLADVARLANSPHPNVALATMGILLKARSPQSLELLKQFLDNYHGDKEPVSVWAIGSYLREIRDPDALPTLEALTTSKFTSVKLGAMDALRGIRSTSSAPSLIARLDDSDKTVQYQALIALAEAFGKDREFAPSIPVFEQDPQKYLSLWKTWWNQQPTHSFPRPAKQPDARVPPQ